MTTRPTGEQLRFISQNTGSHVLDDYLENAERGTRTLADLMADLFDVNGTLDGYQFRVTNGQLEVSAAGGAYAVIADIASIAAGEVGDAVFTEIGALQQEPTGFVNRALSTLSFNEGARELTLAPTGANFDIYVHGTKYTKTAQNITIADTDATNYIYFDSAGAIQQTTTHPTAGTTLPIAVIVWDATNNRAIVTDARKGVVQDWATHTRFAHVDGARYVSGLALNTYAVQPATPANADNRFGVDAGVIASEDAEHAVSALTAATTYRLLHRDGATGAWRSTPAATDPFHAGTYVQANIYSGGSWSLSDLVSDEYVNYWLLASTNNQFFLVPGQIKHADLASAKEESVYDVSWGDLPTDKLAVIARVTFRANTAYTTTGKARIEHAVRQLTQRLTLASTVTGHNSLSGRTDAGSHPATAVSVTPAGNLASTNVQAALEEIQTQLDGAVFASVDINGGTIDNTAIGATTRSTARVTTLDANGLATLSSVDINGGNIDGTAIGATTPAAATVTTMTATTYVNLPNATDAAKGVIELATQAEVTAGADATRAVTPATLAGYTVALTRVAINGATAETSVALADELPLYDASAAANRKMTVENVLKSINLLTEDVTPDTANDFVMTWDSSANTVKKAKPSALSAVAAGNWEKLGEAVVSVAAAYVEFTGIDATVDDIWLFGSIIPSSDSVSLLMRTHGADGVIDTGGSDYQYGGNDGYVTNYLLIEPAGDPSPPATYGKGLVYSNSNSASSMLLSFSCDQNDPQVIDILGTDIQAARFTGFRSIVCGDSNTLISATATMHGARREAARITGVRLLFSSGNVAAGTRITLMGRKGA